MSEAARPSRLSSDEWRRVGAVLDRVHEAHADLRESILLHACREQGLAVDEVRRFVEAEERSDVLPELIPADLIAGAFGDAATDLVDVRARPGQTLGAYQILASLGTGGMGEVYRAKDTRLDRTVAIKVLRAHLLESADARQRFQQEARAISRLNHPHVCTLYDVGHQEGIDFLVMEYVEGETLAERLQRGRIPVAQAIRIGSQIADALHRAHRQGIVHRDLKPANIILARGGVKLLDFGLAQLDAAAARDERALLGTPQYMSPEQLEGRQADARSDIFACGAVLYEMLTGKRAFTGSVQADVIAAILQKEPTPVGQLTQDVPATLEWTISKCLAKDPEDRWQSAADVKHHLDWLAVSAGTPQRSTRSTRSVLWIAATIAVAAISIGAWGWRQRAADAPPAAPSIFPIYPPPGTTFDLTHAISPDGRRIAFATYQTDGPRDAPRQLWIRSLDSLAPQRIAGSDGATHPFWSPDGRSVGFFADRKLKKVDLTSGYIHVICDVAGAGGGASWNSDDVIVFSASMGQATGLWRVKASGGPATVITPTEEGRRDGWPRFLPDGQRFIYLSAGSSDQGLYISRLDSTDAHLPIMRPSVIPPTKAILADDVIFFLDQATLMAQRFNAARMAPVGDPVRVAENVRWGPPGMAAFDAAAGGVVAYRQPAPERLAQLTWLDHSGKTIAHVGEPAPIVWVAISPDGKSALVNEWNDRGRAASGTVKRIDLQTGAATSLYANAAMPIWSPDGSRIAFTQFSLGRGAVPTPTIAALDGRATPQPFAGFRTQGHATDWSRDGRFIIGSAAHADTSWDIWIADAEGRKPLRYLTREPFHQRYAQISPDGRWVAYASSDARGGSDIYLRSFADGSGLQRVSTRGGRSPRWRSDGRELYFVESGGRLMRVRIATKPDLSLRAPELVFQHAGLTNALESPTGFAYDVAADGRFLVAIPTSDDIPTTPIVVMLNWRLPGGR